MKRCVLFYYMLKRLNLFLLNFVSPFCLLNSTPVQLRACFSVPHQSQPLQSQPPRWLRGMDVPGILRAGA